MSPVDAMARFRATRLVAPTGFDYFVVFYIHQIIRTTYLHLLSFLMIQVSITDVLKRGRASGHLNIGSPYSLTDKDAEYVRDAT